MSIATAQLFVRVPASHDVAQVATRYVERWKAADASAESAPAGRRFWTPRGDRTLIILPVLGGWCALLEGPVGHGDTDLARALSRECGCHAVRIEYDGPRLAWMAQIWRDGAVQRVEMSSGWESPPDGPLPHYEDAELQAFRFLKSQGIPENHLLLMTDDVRDEGRAHQGEAAAVILTTVRAPEVATGAYVFRPRTPVRPSGAVPVRLDALEQVRRRGVERLRLPGRPGEASVRQLLEVLRAMAQRRHSLARSIHFDIRSLPPLPPNTLRDALAREIKKRSRLGGLISAYRFSV